MLEVKAMVPSIVPAIPEAVRRFCGSGLLRLGGVGRVALAQSRRMLVVVRVEQLEARGSATVEGARRSDASRASSPSCPGG